MKKNNIRDYAVSAFRFYSLFLKKEKHIVLPQNNMLASGSILDIIAVKKTLDELNKTERGREIIKAVKIVYFTMPERPIKRGEITDRVNKAATEIHTSQPTIYRFLNCAEVLFAKNRGLRIS